nr:5-(carboxyamino)imidazole ribonucleotide synthase [Acidobacteriota bacterium]
MRIGVLGSGQLGRMLALAGYPLGLEFAFLDPSDGVPVRLLADFKRAPFDDRAGLDWLAGSCDVVTYEFENVPA